MKTDKQQITEKLMENYDLNQRTIGVDLAAEEIVEAVMHTIPDLEIPELEERLEKYNGKRFQTFGKIELLTEMQEEAHE